jgi:hypothetical protein
MKLLLYIFFSITFIASLLAAAYVDAGHTSDASTELALLVVTVFACVKGVVLAFSCIFCTREEDRRELFIRVGLYVDFFLAVCGACISFGFCLTGWTVYVNTAWVLILLLMHIISRQDSYNEPLRNVAHDLQEMSVLINNFSDDPMHSRQWNA